MSFDELMREPQKNAQQKQKTAWGDRRQKKAKGWIASRAMSFKSFAASMLTTRLAEDDPGEPTTEEDGEMDAYSRERMMWRLKSLLTVPHGPPTQEQQKQRRDRQQKRPGSSLPRSPR
jgi:hypothetical protein